MVRWSLPQDPRENTITELGKKEERGAGMELQ